MPVKIPDISYILPVKDEEANVALVYRELIRHTPDTYSFEIIFIDDGSQDKSLAQISKLAQKDSRVKYLSFSKNFGHQIALKAGLDHAQGRCVISLDCDLQHPPKLIPTLLNWWAKGYQVVYTIRQDSKTSWLKKYSAALFYRVMRYISDVQLDNGVADYRLLDRQVVDRLKEMHESALFLRGMVKWMGYRQIAVPYEPKRRQHGQSKYSFSKMLSFGFDGITSFSIKPLRISIAVGFLVTIIAALYGIYAIYVHLRGDNTITGWTSMIISVLFLGGIQLISLGILGEYIGKIFMEVKNRPLYLIQDKKL